MPEIQKNDDEASDGGLRTTALFGSLRAEIEYATTQKKACLADSVDRESRDDASGAAYYKGLAVAYAQMAQRLKYLLPNA